MRPQPSRWAVLATAFALAALLAFIGVAVTAQVPLRSINSTSQNRASQPATLVPEQPYERLIAYSILAANDLGMHCGDFDHREVSILPPFNTQHAQVIRKGRRPVILDGTQARVVYSAVSNPTDPARSKPVPSSVFKTNFWDVNPRTGRPIAYDAYDAHYPPGVLQLFPLLPDWGLPVPDIERLYLGDGQLVADQQALPSRTGPGLSADPYVANVPQPFNVFYRSFPFFVSFPFGYTLPDVKLFSAEGIPMTPFDDLGRSNPYPMMRIQATAAEGNSLGLAAGTVMASLDTVTPVSGELNCRECHTSPVDGGNGMATSGKGFTVATRHDDPQFGRVPDEVSVEYAFDLNILRLHDVKHATSLEDATPVSCQRCHYSPALDLAHVGPKGLADPDGNGREQVTHQTMSRVIHTFHGALRNSDGSPLFPEMPSPAGRSEETRDAVLDQTCYQCHPGKITKCFRGVMFAGGLGCQDCHGNMTQVGNDFSKNVSPSTPGAFVLAGDYYTNPATPRVPWANEPLCQSCHTGDAVRSLATSRRVVRAPDGIRLLQAFRTNDPNAKPIVATNRRFAENAVGIKQVLYRLSKGHAGLACEGCHGSTHAEWATHDPLANDNRTPIQLQGYAGTVRECATCHGTGAFRIDDFKGRFDASGQMRGPHGMHPVNDPMWVHDHKEVFNDDRTPAGTCQACHGRQLEGTVLAKVPVERMLQCKESPGCRETRDGKRITLAAGTEVSCSLCHRTPRQEG